MFPPDAAPVNSAPPPSASAPLSETVSAPRGKCLDWCNSGWWPGWHSQPTKHATLNSPTVLLLSRRQSSPGKKSISCFNFPAQVGPDMLGCLGLWAWGSVVYSQIILGASWLWGNDVYAVNQKCKGWRCELCLRGDLLQNAASVSWGPSRDVHNARYST